MPASAWFAIIVTGGVALFVVGRIALAITSFVLSRRRDICPACSKKALAMTGTTVAARKIEPSADGRSWSEYECDHCHLQFVKPLGGRIMDRQAWIAGGSLPAAVVVRRDRS